MKRRQRTLHQAGEHDRDEDEHLLPGIQIQAVQHAELEGPLAGLVHRFGAERDDRGQQQDAAGQRVHEERHRRRTPLAPTEDEDQDAHGNQHRLPVDEEQHQVLRDEGA